MIGGLRQAVEDAERHTGVTGGLAANRLEHFRRHVVRAGERRQNAARSQQPHRTQIDLLVAARRGVERVPPAGERRGVQDHQTETLA